MLSSPLGQGQELVAKGLFATERLKPSEIDEGMEEEGVAKGLFATERLKLADCKRHSKTRRDVAKGLFATERLKPGMRSPVVSVRAMWQKGFSRLSD